MRTLDLTDAQCEFIAKLLVRHSVAASSFLRSRAGECLSVDEVEHIRSEILLGAIVLGRLPHYPSLAPIVQTPEAISV